MDCVWLLYAGDEFFRASTFDTQPEKTENEIRHALDGNLCRCTGYQYIVTRSNTRRKE